jgi:hypothetical protein
MAHAHHIMHITAAAMPRVDARAVAGSPARDCVGMFLDGGMRLIRVVSQ